MLSFFNNNKNSITLIFFSLFFILGFNIYDDYGISIDEDNTRLNGLVSLKYIFSIFEIEPSNYFKNIPDINEWSESGIGFIFDLPTAFLEYFLNIEDSRNYYLMRHWVNFIFFFIGVWYFYLVIKLRFNSKYFALLGALFLIMTPRIFADSFYNNKDIIFLSLIIITTYYAIKLIEKNNLLYSFLFSFTAALSIGIRVIGVVLPLILIFVFIINILRNEKSRYKIIKVFLSFLIFLPFLIIMFYPFLWENPIQNFFLIFNKLKNFDINIYNFFLGKYISAENIPWYYSIVWIFISTPIFYTIFFLFGFYMILKRLIKRLFKIEKNNSYNDLWRGPKELQDIIHLLIIFIPIFAIIIFDSTLYNGWRHLYFIYPSLIFISLFGLNIIRIKYFKKVKILFLALVLLIMSPTMMWMIKNHPHQYVYFNTFLNGKYDKYFEMDYWGVSNYNSLIYISSNTKKKITVSNFGNSDLNLSKSLLPKNLRKKIIISGTFDNSDFIINNFTFWKGRNLKKEKLLNKNFEKYYEIKVDDVSINVIYKKRNG